MIINEIIRAIIAGRDLSKKDHSEQITKLLTGFENEITARLINQIIFAVNQYLPTDQNSVVIANNENHVEKLDETTETNEPRTNEKNEVLKLMINRNEVLELAGITSKTCLNNWINEEGFPAGFTIPPNKKGAPKKWFKKDVERWLSHRKKNKKKIRKTDEPTVNLQMNLIDKPIDKPIDETVEEEIDFNNEDAVKDALEFALKDILTI